MKLKKDMETKYKLEGIVILDNGEERNETYGDNNIGDDMDFIKTVKDYILPEWNSTAMGGYGKTLCVLDKINNTTGKKTRIYRKSKPEILREIEHYGYLKTTTNSEIKH